MATSVQVRQNPEDDDGRRDERQETRRRHGLVPFRWLVALAHPDPLALIADPGSR